MRKMSPSTPSSMKHRGSTGTIPKRDPCSRDSSGARGGEKEPFIRGGGLGESELMELRKTLTSMDRRIIEAMGGPSGAKEREKYWSRLDEREELLEIRRGVSDLGRRLNAVLGERRSSSYEEDLPYYNSSRRDPYEYRRRDDEILELSRSVNQCYRGLLKLSGDVNRLTRSVHRLNFYGGSLDESDSESTLYDDEDDDPCTLNNKFPSQAGIRPNNYWDNFWSSSRQNPIADHQYLSRRRSKINREHNVDSSSTSRQIPTSARVIHPILRTIDASGKKKKKRLPPINLDSYNRNNFTKSHHSLSEEGAVGGDVQRRSDSSVGGARALFANKNLAETSSRSKIVKKERSLTNTEEDEDCRPTFNMVYAPPRSPATNNPEPEADQLVDVRGGTNSKYKNREGNQNNEGVDLDRVPTKLSSSDLENLARQVHNLHSLVDEVLNTTESSSSDFD